MVKVQKIEFEVDMNAGELPYRSYASTEPVAGNMFVLVSKLLEDDSVFFKLFTCDIKTGDATCRMERTTSQEKFHQSVKVLESDLQKSTPTVQLARQNGTGVAIGQNGPIDMAKLNGTDLSKLIDLKKQLESKEITPVDFAVECVKGKVVPAQELAELICQFPIELQMEIANRLVKEFDMAGAPASLKEHGDKLMGDLQSILSLKKEMNNGPSSRINKFL